MSSARTEAGLFPDQTAAENCGVGSIFFLSCDICHHTSNR